MTEVQQPEQADPVQPGAPAVPAQAAPVPEVPVQPQQQAEQAEPVVQPLLQPVQPQLTVLERVTKAKEQFLALTGIEPEAISGLSQVDGGWELAIDVVEVHRIPETVSLMATYRVTTDDAGDVAGYERVRRFNRSEAG